MAAYRRVYDCQEPGSAPEPYARQSSTGYLYLGLWQYARLSDEGACSGTDVTLLDTLARLDKDSGLGRTDESIQIRDSSAERVFVITIFRGKISPNLLLSVSCF